MDKFGKLFGDPKDRKPVKPWAGIASGIAIGVALGLAMNNLAGGIALAVAIGVAFESTSKQKDNSNDRPNP